MDVLVDVDDEAVIGLGGLDRPLLGDAKLQVNVIRRRHTQGCGRAHPVQRLVGTAV
jgi:hypothetical protein